MPIHCYLHSRFGLDVVKNTTGFLTASWASPTRTLVSPTLVASLLFYLFPCIITVICASPFPEISSRLSACWMWITLCYSSTIAAPLFSVFCIEVFCYIYSTVFPASRSIFAAANRSVFLVGLVLYWRRGVGILWFSCIIHSIGTPVDN